MKRGKSFACMNGKASTRSQFYSFLIQDYTHTFDGSSKTIKIKELPTFQNPESFVLKILN